MPVTAPVLESRPSGAAPRSSRERPRLADAALVCVFTLCALLLLVANPGYFSHDELQKLDHVSRFGLADYLAHYVRITTGTDFSTPVRPFSFLIQGLLALAMENYPVAVHLFAVLVHAAVAVLLYLVCLRFGARRQAALAAALVFAFNPMGLLAVGWSAALMDQWYVLFGLLALLASERCIEGPHTARWPWWALAGCSALAILSKETALILPGVLLLGVLQRPARLREARFWLAGLVWSLPIALFLVWRLPALVASFSGHAATGSYTPHWQNIPDGLWQYLAYPFLVPIGEANNWPLFSPAWRVGALCAHLLLMAALLALQGWRALAAYLYLYLLFLIPILSIDQRGSHYLYGSALVTSAAVALLCACLTDRRRIAGMPWPRLLGALLGTLLLLHSWYLQRWIYDRGTCMARLMTTAEAAYVAAGQPARVDLRAEPGSAEYMLRLFSTGREQIGRHYPVQFSVSALDAPLEGGVLTLRLDPRCLLEVMGR